MTLDELQEFLDTYGANPDRWPASKRAEAWRLIDSEPFAGDMLDAAMRLEEALAGDPPPASAGAVDALMARIDAHERTSARTVRHASAASSLTATARGIAAEISGLLFRPALTLGLFALCGVAAGVLEYYLQSPHGTLPYFEYLYSALAI